MLLRGKGRLTEEDLQLLQGQRPRHDEKRPPLSLSEPMPATVPTQCVEAIVALFDLSGFTSFCSQASPPTIIPAFLDSFLEWVFGKIEDATAAYDGPATEPLWKEPPFFAKFLGDGILLLWDTGNMAERQVARLITTLLGICHVYHSEFYGKMSERVKNPPQSLRCRLAKGTVFSVNNGRDYVGHCINIAAHLQQYKLLNFCVAGEGFNAHESLEASLATQLLSLSLPIKGISTNQPVWVLRSDVESLKASGPLPAASR